MSDCSTAIMPSPKLVTLLAITATFILILSACTPMIHPAGEPNRSCHITENKFITADAVQLPLKTWHPPQAKIKSVIIAVHGFNDYSNFFQQPGGYLSQRQIMSYAYDQRGFGASPKRGLWAGIDTYTNDLICFTQQIKNKHPELPIYLLGESMGGAIVISTVTHSKKPPVEGIILVAPAVWGRQAMPWYQNTLLWTLSHTMPWLTLTGQNMEIQASDNIDMLRELGNDPLIIKETRIESIYGLVNLMDHASSNSHLISTNTLFLYGEKDEVIPKKPVYQFLQTMKKNEKIKHTVSLYENGFHMLLRDLKASILWDDIDVWISSTVSRPSIGIGGR
ncbi:MAG: lysophospholipase [Methylococcaceae bacterium]